MKKTTKARPAVGERSAELVQELRSLGANPENFLYLAVEAEHKVRSAPPPRSLVTMIEEHGALVLFSPSVLHELCRAAAIANGAEPGEEEGSGKRARTLLARVFKALASAGEMSRLMDERRKAREVLVLAKAVQVEAERLAARFKRLRATDGRPSCAAIAQARRHVAEEAGLSVGAIQQRIRRTQADYPDATWPAIMPRAPKNPRP